MFEGVRILKGEVCENVVDESLNLPGSEPAVGVSTTRGDFPVNKTSEWTREDHTMFDTNYTNLSNTCHNKEANISIDMRINAIFVYERIL